MQSSAGTPQSDIFITSPTLEELAALSISSFGYALPAHQLPVYHEAVCAILESGHALSSIAITRCEETAPDPIATELLDVPQECKPRREEGICANTQPREFTLLPGSGPSNPYGAWTVRCHLTQDSTDSSLPLKGKRVALKDIIPVRGLPMSCGTSFSFTPLKDSPLVTRCLAAGATIVGIAQCEYMCMSGASHTASAGLVHNPLAVEYHAGGSSSGCAVLVASGEADLSIGSDQGGSCRIPSAITGVVGCKPTHGLVPYTLMDGMYAPIDHAGPITRTVEENAVMLGVLAGWDGADERASIIARQTKKINYCSELKRGVEGMRIGVLREAFTHPQIDQDVVVACLDAAKLLKQLGAVVEDVSVPLHSVGGDIWVLFVLQKVVENLFYSCESELLGVDKDGKQWNRAEFLREQLLENVASWSVPFRWGILVGEWLRQRHPEAHKVGEAYRKQLTESYEAALSKYEVLLMPTVPVKAMKLPRDLGTASEYEEATEELLQAHARLSIGLGTFMAPTNLTGHPAVCVPVSSGIVEEGLALPLSLMLVGKRFQEATLYRVAYSIEEAFPCMHNFSFKLVS